MERQDDYPIFTPDKADGFCRRRNGRMEVRHHLGVDASVANSQSSATGAIQFGNVTNGSAGTSNTTLAIIVAVVLVFGVGLFFLFKKN